MACNCIEEINAELAKRNTQLTQAIMFSPSGRSLIISTEVKEKRRGYKPVIVFPTFCPFCGTRYEAARAAEKEEAA